MRFARPALENDVTDLLFPALVLSAVFLAVFSLRRIVKEVPKDDRQYMDPPPRFYRMTWPLVRLVSHYCGWALSQGMAIRIQEALPPGSGCSPGLRAEK